MFRSLWFRLVGTLAIVIGVALFVVTFTANKIAEREFGLYTVRGGQVWARQFVPVLASVYEQDGGWQNAQEALSNPWQGGNGQRRFGMGQMMGQGGHMQGMDIDGDMWSAMNIRLLLADVDGVIVADTQDALRGQRLTDEMIRRGTPVIVEEQRVGTLAVLATEPGIVLDPTGTGFLQVTRRAVLTAAFAAGIAGILMGTFLFRRITLPLNALQKAARTVESGEKVTPVPVTSHDEVGMVADAFNQMTARLERQQQLRKQMVGDIAHELRTPLSVMQATIEAMLDGVLHPNKTELRSLHNEIRRLTRMVEELRTLSLADEGQLRLELIEVDPAALVEQVTHAMDQIARERDIHLASEISRPLGTIHADGDRMAEVLTNLIGNALRHAPDGGHVTVSARQSEAKVILSVEDDGPGIAEEDLPFVFERFWRGDKSRSRGSGGSGIGLAIVKQLVELHGGKVSVTSASGEGAVFQVALPLA